MKQFEIVYSIDELPKIIKLLSKYFLGCRLITFSGPLGAGKTTLIKELLGNYGIKKDEITSPTFTYLNIYQNDEGEKFYHFDLYRISTVEDFLQAGFDEYLSNQNSKCLIEWPEVIEPLINSIDQKVCKINLDYPENKDKRILKFTINNIFFKN